MNILLLEDQSWKSFQPLTLLRPVFELLGGHRSIRQRCLEVLKPQQWGVKIRPELAEVYKQEQPSAHVNSLDGLSNEPVLCIHGQFWGNPLDLAQLQTDEVAICDQTPVAWWLSPEQIPQIDIHNPSLTSGFASIASQKKPVAVQGRVAQYAWDLILNNGDLIELDAALNQQTPLPVPDHVHVVGPTEKLFIDPTASIEPCVVINTTGGSVTIGPNAQIQAFTRIEGPAYIGAHTQVFRGNLREQTSLGPVCRVGGEVEGSILHGYANTYHDGFLGHSYVCPWVNLGALTTNSDLKNDYSDVKMIIAGDAVNSGSKKMGCLLGDHTKTAIGSLFNTGTTVGVMSMILPGGSLPPKHIPSFCRIWNGVLDDQVDLESGLQVAETAMGRRNCQLTEEMKDLLRFTVAQTEIERINALKREQARRS